MWPVTQALSRLSAHCNEATYPDQIVDRFSSVPNTLSGMDDAILLQYKVLYMMEYFIGCSCFDKGTKIVECRCYLWINFQNFKLSKFNFLLQVCKDWYFLFELLSEWKRVPLDDTDLDCNKNFGGNMFLSAPHSGCALALPLVGIRLSAVINSTIP